MAPFSFAFFVAWSALLLGWHALGFDLGPVGPLTSIPPP